jgi:hypothetical protein
MGIQDREWYRQAQREREKQRQMDETRAKFSEFSGAHLILRVHSRQLAATAHLGITT